MPREIHTIPRRAAAPAAKQPERGFAELARQLKGDVCRRLPERQWLDHPHIAKTPLDAGRGA